MIQSWQNLLKGKVSCDHFLFWSYAVTLRFSFSVTVQCTYQLAGLHRLFSVFRFESDTAGVGTIVRTARTKAGTERGSTAGAQMTLIGL